MRNWAKELDARIAYIRRILEDSGARGIVFGNSGGKDSALVGILCKKAFDNTLGVLMPCGSSRNYGEDAKDGLEVAEAFGIESRTVDLTPVKEAMLASLKGATQVNASADTNIAPRLRMTTLYAIAASEDRLVAGTGNRSEAYMGYFTKWGDGAYDFNPIADLTVTEVYDFLAFLDAPAAVRKKAPSAGLFDGQTDEAEMGLSYQAIDHYLFSGDADERDLQIISRYHKASRHKRRMPLAYPDDGR